MKIDKNLVQRFEQDLNPQKLDNSPIPVSIIGYGEISSIFQINNDTNIVYKRMPLFKDRSSAETYAAQYHEYCNFIKEAGLNLPQDETIIIECPGRPVVLYIAQQQLPAARFAHRLIHDLEEQEIQQLLEQIISTSEKVWEFNRRHSPEIELSLDGQISNWAWVDKNLYFVDTSTPLYKIKGKEQLDPELLLQSAPAFLRWILRLFFLEDVMIRYYNQRLVYIDLAANLHKEQQPDLIPQTLDIINSFLSSITNPVTWEEIKKYYKEDKLIWTLFLAFRRIDRCLTTKLLHKRYEFILPGKIKR
jgi:hypothetical protein